MIDDVSLHGGKRKTSKALFHEAEQVMPGGVTANIKFFEPNPIVMEYAKGSRLFDVDGNEYIDYLLCYGAQIHGHGHEEVMKEVKAQIEKMGTTIFGTPHRLEAEMAKKLVQLYPSIDMVRYTNSGLEATLLATRLAMAYTNKKKIAKFEGHYHGGSDQFLVSVNPSIEEAGSAEQPNPVPESKGIPDYYVENTIILPFNDLEACENLLWKHRHEIAAIIMEPILGGFIPANNEFIQGIRRITKQLNILLIFDEVKTGFRISLGGAQQEYNIKPDITALGKVLGGGFPIGAVGGREDIMMMSAPNKGKDILTAGSRSSNPQETLFHSGTYNGHPTVLAAGLKTIHLLEGQETMKRLIKTTNQLRCGLEDVYSRYGFPMQTVGMGSIFNIILADQPIKNYRDMKHVNMELRKQIDHELLDLGIYTKPLNRYSLSTAHTEEDIALTIAKHEHVLRRLRR
ncbi:aspartate aminotransferase family protein [Salirhabdus salicampi]|uniref:aspartate aminotransferase family protein n=1 Tax=Salirhabdus salicampi TaxID=476102 RepID=UPI0020C3340D|nr:aspartate aminotransferase family protein [Salirhabdus salicampi]MCP8616138.1 aspartate aminotransferase family protein [Salirhabdus salicampi]